MLSLAELACRNDSPRCALSVLQYFNPWNARRRSYLLMVSLLGSACAGRLDSDAFERRPTDSPYSLVCTFVCALESCSLFTRVWMAAAAPCCLTPRWSGRVEDRVPSSNGGVRAAQFNRQTASSATTRRYP